MNKRIPRKKGQPAKSDKHSDLYTDEDPKGTIKGLQFKSSVYGLPDFWISQVLNQRLVLLVLLLETVLLKVIPKWYYL